MANIHVGKSGLDSSTTCPNFCFNEARVKGNLNPPSLTSNTGLTREDSKTSQRQLTSVQGPSKRVVARVHYGGDSPPQHCMGCSIWIPMCLPTMDGLSI